MPSQINAAAPQNISNMYIDVYPFFHPGLLSIAHSAKSLGVQNKN